MKGMLLRQEFKDLPKHINWYPGHMRKAVRDLEDEFKKVNMFIEV
jgi:ribosome biogenesis GTPase A